MERRLGRKRISGAAAALTGLLIVGVGTAGYAVYKTSAPSAEAATYTPAVPTIAANPHLPTMAIVGDSFASTGSDDWPARTARCAGYVAAISGVRSSGFFNPGISVPYGYPERMKAVTTTRPDVVIFETAYNDARAAESQPERVQKAAIDAITAYRKVAPKAKYVILGPFPTDRFKGPNITNNVAALRAAAAATGATHILPTAAWQPSTAYTKNDLAHPNEKGHHYLASQLLLALRDSGVIASTGGCEKLPA